jgi:cytochrome b561
MTRTSGYSAAQIALHWAVVVLVAAQYVFKGTIAAAWDAIVAGRAYEFHPLILAHVGGGMLILVLVLARLALRVKRGAPPPPENEPAILKLVAHAVHGAFYLVLILMSASGGMAWFTGAQTAAAAHNLFKVVLLALIAMHVLAIPFHALVLKNNVMRRMVRPEA